MKFTDATKSNRKSGVAQWRDLRFLLVLTWTLKPSSVRACGRLLNRALRSAG